jgi:crotonobetainyl-CoA:carnitine CoA-transferase CaiB-like acyl-CoA transferase
MLASSKGMPFLSFVGVSLTDYFSMLNLMEGIVPEYDRKGVIRGPSGSSVTGIVPTNAYPCLPTASAAPTYIIIGANADSMYERLMRMIGRTDLTGEQYKHNQHRVARQVEIEDAIKAWTCTKTVEDALVALEVVGVPAGRVVNVKHIVESEQVRARGAVEDVWVGEPGTEGTDRGWSVKMPRPAPVLEGIDTRTRWAGPDLGAHNEDVLCGELGLSRADVDGLIERGVVGAWSK